MMKYQHPPVTPTPQLPTASNSFQPQRVETCRLPAGNRACSRIARANRGQIDVGGIVVWHHKAMKNDEDISYRWVMNTTSYFHSYDIYP